jgi:potassium efflux system protein
MTDWRQRAGAIVLSLLLIPTVLAQDVTLSTVPTDGTATREQVETLITAVSAREDLDEETRTSVLERLQAARDFADRRLASIAAAAEFAAALEEAPAETASIRAELDAAAPADVTPESLGITGQMTLAEAEQLLSQEQASLAAINTSLADLQSRITAQEVRPQEARQRITELRASREALAATIAAAPVPGESALLSNAARLAASLQRAAQGAEIASLEGEVLSHTARLDLLNARRDAAERARSEGDERVAVALAAVNELRQSAALLAQQAAAAAELAASDQHPIVRELAEGNAALTLELPEIARRTQAVTAQLTLAESETAELEDRLARSRLRVEIGGLSRATGQLLVEERRDLPQVSRYRSQLRARGRILADIGLSQLRVQDERRSLSSIDVRVNEAIAGIADDIDDEEALEEIREQLRLLLRDRRDLLAQVQRTYSTYQQALGNLDTAQRRVLDVAETYRVFLSENQIWIPSAPIAGLGEWREIGDVVARATSPSSWLQTANALVSSLYEHPAESVLILLALALLFLSRRPLRAKRAEMNTRVGRLSTDNIGLTLGTLAIAAIRSLAWPMLIWFAGFMLKQSEDATEFSDDVADAVLNVAPFLYNLLLFRALAVKDGLLAVHFLWRQDSLALIRKQLRRLIVIGGPLVFAAGFFYISEHAIDRDTVGRIAFVALMIVLSMAIHPLAHPKTGVVAAYYEGTPDHWASRLRWVWYAFAGIGPLVLAGLSILGYLYTAATLTGLLVDTIWLALVMIVVHQIVLRWLVLARRKLAWQRALEERAARKAQPDEVAKVADETEAPVVVEEQVDLEQVDQQTRKLLRSVLFLVGTVFVWAIWVEVMPAFNILDQVTLWTKADLVDGVSTTTPVTLADLFLALIVAAVTLIAARNLPGLMEIAVLQRLELDSGSRFAANTLVRYAVLAFGALSVLDIIGWNWGQVQWLVAALGVGLGFGLQEIVANFVSGLIILFERPVRVGDTVTVGQLTGTVSRVRIRATTITDWDRKEIVVPNKSFITEQVINWTLSDPITRIVVPVGVSYGSDVELAHRVMAETLHSLPLVLDEPPPRVYFVGFGDSSLDFKLYVYSRQLADRLPLTHAVHESILEALRKNGIEIPFPQRDLHIRSTVQTDGGAT